LGEGQWHTRSRVVTGIPAIRKRLRAYVQRRRRTEYEFRDDLYDGQPRDASTLLDCD